MQAIIFVLLIALIFILVHAGIIWAAAFVLLVIIADLIGGIFSSIFGFAKATKNVVYETALEEAAEVEAAKGKPPSGKKFFADVASKIGKGVGKAEKAKAEGKKIGDNLSVASISQSIANFMEGLGKIFKK